jgi:hypothetical protein
MKCAFRVVAAFEGAKRLECGDSSPLSFDGQTANSPGDCHRQHRTESADKSAHSKRFASFRAPIHFGAVAFRSRSMAERGKRWS